MNWKAFLNSLATAIISGAVSGLAATYGDPTHIHLGGAGGAAAAGAAVGVINLLRQRPHDQAPQDAPAPTDPGKQ